VTSTRHEGRPATERRRQPHVPCRTPAAGPAGIAVIKDLSATGARVIARAAPKIGSRLPLRLYQEGGRTLRLEGAVRRVRVVGGGEFEIGCSFESDAQSGWAAWHLTKTLSGPAPAPLDFVPPPNHAVRTRSRGGSSLKDYFSIEGFLFFVISVVVLLLGSVLAVGYFGAR
jgi:hypothetical protein